MVAVDIEKIRDFYKPELDCEPNTTIYYLRVGTEKRRVSLLDNKRKIILTFGLKVKDEKEAIEKGCLITNGKELGIALFPEHWESIKHIYEPDKRTESYLRKVRDNIGLIEIKHGWDGIKFEVLDQYSIWANLTGSGMVDVGKDDKNQWIAEYSLRTDIDDYVIVDYVFKNKPSRRNIMIAKLLEDIETYFTSKGWDKHEFRCWECGKKQHWLDIPGSIEEKWSNFKDSYCGC